MELEKEEEIFKPKNIKYNLLGRKMNKKYIKGSTIKLDIVFKVG